MSVKQEFLDAGCSAQQQPDSVYVVSFWVVPGGCDYDQAYGVRLYHSEAVKSEVEKIIDRYSSPPEMAFHYPLLS